MQISPPESVINVQVKTYNPARGTMNDPECLLYPFPVFVCTKSNTRVWWLDNWSSFVEKYAENAIGDVIGLVVEVIPIKQFKC